MSCQTGDCIAVTYNSTQGCEERTVPPESMVDGGLVERLSGVDGVLIPAV